MRFSLCASILALPLLAFAATEDQQILSHGNLDEMTEIKTHTQPSLADLLTIESSASIFYSYARELELSKLFNEEGKEKMTLLVPTNKAVQALARKPHESPKKSVEPEISEEQFEGVSRKNVERWVSAHIIPRSPITLTSETYDTLLSGKSVTFKPLKGSDESKPEWARVTLDEDGGARIIGMKEASNGVLYLIDGTVMVD